MNLERVRAALPGRRIDYHVSIDSTMHEAARLAEAHVAAGTTVLADEQTAGIGRYRRQWHSEPETGLYLSVVLRPQLPAEVLSLVTMALGLAVAEAIRRAADIECDLRWPNDVLIADRKCAGILTQADGEAVVAGIGINVNHSAFPAELANVATSLRLASGRVQSREEILIALLPEIDAECTRLRDEGKRAILEKFAKASSYVEGRRVTVDREQSVLVGTTAGLTSEGFLKVRDDEQREHVILAGGVRPCC